MVSDRLQVLDPKKDTIFSLANDQFLDAVHINIDGMLSDTAVVAVSTDSTFLSKATYFVNTPKISFSQNIEMTAIRSDFLYIKYHPIRNANDGHIKIGVTFL